MELEEAVGSRVVRYDPTSQQYQCTVCNKEGSHDLQPHVRSSSHKNSLTWEAFSRPSDSLHLIRFLSDVFQTAKQNDEVEAVNKAVFSYRCKICVGKKPFTGMAPLEAHLRGQEHEKSRNKSRLQLLSQNPGQDSLPPPSPLPVSPFHRAAPVSPPVSAYPGSVSSNFSSNASSRSQLPSTSVLTTNTAFLPGASNRLVRDYIACDPLSPEARQAVNSGIVVEDKQSRSGSSYHCTICNKPMTGEQPLNQHVVGKEHIKKSQAAMMKFVPDSRNIPGRDPPGGDLANDMDIAVAADRITHQDTRIHESESVQHTQQASEDVPSQQPPLSQILKKCRQVQRVKKEHGGVHARDIPSVEKQKDEGTRPKTSSGNIDLRSVPQDNKQQITKGDHLPNIRYRDASPPPDVQQIRQEQKVESIYSSEESYMSIPSGDQELYEGPQGSQARSGDFPGIRMLRQYQYDQHPHRHCEDVLLSNTDLVGDLQLPQTNNRDVVSTRSQDYQNIQYPQSNFRDVFSVDLRLSRSSHQYQSPQHPMTNSVDVLSSDLLLSRDHRNILVWETVHQSSPSDDLLSLLPNVVYNAKLHNEVEALDRSLFSYRCKICPAKRPFTGLTPLMAHLNGQEHEKSRKRLQLIYSSPDRDNTASQSVMPVSLPASQAPVRVPTSQGPVCVSTPQGPVRVPTPQGPVHEPPSHVPFDITAASQNFSSVQYAGGSHFKNSSGSFSDVRKELHHQGEDQFAHVNLPRPFQSPAQSCLDVADHTFYVDEGKAAGASSQVRLFTSSDFYIPRTPLFATPEMTPMEVDEPEQGTVRGIQQRLDPLSPEARAALTHGLVVEKNPCKSGLQYFCQCCSVSLSGTEPLEQHIRGGKHRKNQQAQVGQRLQARPPPSSSLVGVIL